MIKEQNCKKFSKKGTKIYQEKKHEAIERLTMVLVFAMMLLVSFLLTNNWFEMIIIAITLIPMGILDYNILFIIFTNTESKKDKIIGFLILNLFFCFVVYLAEKVIKVELFMAIIMSYILIEMILIILFFAFFYIIEPLIILFKKEKN